MKIPKAGEFYFDQNQKLYQIITTAIDGVTGNQLVIYQALYGDFTTYALPNDSFMHDFEQQHQFDTYNHDVEQQTEVTSNHRHLQQANRCEGESKKTLTDFLDADSYKDKLDILHQMHTYIDQFTLDSITVSIDYVPNGNTIDEQYYSLCKYLEMKINYESRR